jgi:hypothetical protein
MPKPVKKKQKSPPKDVNLWARHMVEQSTAEPETEAPPAIAPAALSAYMSALGRKGGLVGGKRRLKTMTKKARIAVAEKAAAARWKGHTKKVKT